MPRRRRFLDRTHRARERRARKGAGPDPSAMIRWAGLGAAAMIALAVFIGFTGGEDGLQRAAALEALTRPVFLGLSAMEIGAGVIILLIALAAWAQVRAMRGRD